MLMHRESDAKKEAERQRWGGVEKKNSAIA